MQKHPSRSGLIGILATVAMSAGCEAQAGAASSKLVPLAPVITCEGAAAARAAMRAQTGLPIVRVIDTHAHLDHSYGNAYWRDRGARPVACAGLREELAKWGPELLGGGPRSSRPRSPSYVKSGTTFGSGPSGERLARERRSLSARRSRDVPKPRRRQHVAAISTATDWRKQRES